MSLIFFAQTEHGDFSRLLQKAFSSLLHTCKQHGHQNKSALLKQRIKNCKDSKLLLTAASPAAFFFRKLRDRNLLVGGEHEFKRPGERRQSTRRLQEPPISRNSTAAKPPSRHVDDLLEEGPVPSNFQARGSPGLLASPLPPPGNRKGRSCVIQRRQNPGGQVSQGPREDAHDLIPRVVLCQPVLAWRTTCRLLCAACCFLN